MNFKKVDLEKWNETRDDHFNRFLKSQPQKTYRDKKAPLGRMLTVDELSIRMTKELLGYRLSFLTDEIIAWIVSDFVDWMIDYRTENSEPGLDKKPPLVMGEDEENQEEETLTFEI